MLPPPLEEGGVTFTNSTEEFLNGFHQSRLFRMLTKMIQMDPHHTFMAVKSQKKSH